MRLGFVVPRYGPMIVGGAERLCRQYAERLASRGHGVEVFTTCARDHVTWRNAQAPGDQTINGVRVHRYATGPPKDLDLVAALEARVRARDELDLVGQLAWVLNAGASDTLLDAIDAAADRVDALVFLPYLFATTCFGLSVRPARSLVIPCLHDEPYARFAVLQRAMQGARGMIYNSAAERRLAERLIVDLPPSRVVGVGFDEPHTNGRRPPRRIRSIGPYVAYAGRREAGKNWPLLVSWMTLYAKALSTSGAMPLAAMGGGTLTMPAAARGVVLDLGRVDEQTKHAVLAAATLTAQLSVNESFSYAIFESWLARTPVVVHTECPVTREFCQASGGGLWAGSDEEFAVILDEVRTGSELRERLGRAGYSYVMDQFRWPTVIERLEAAISELMA